MRIVNGDDSKQEIKLRSPLAVKACLSDRRDSEEYIVFQGYTSYQELCQKIQNKFGIEFFVLMTKDDSGNGYSKEIASPADYREVVRHTTTAAEANGCIALMKLNVQIDTEESESEVC
ncbi:hypothetical protein EC973_004270 [Apophysomyces ossiformis]|uniref:Uncharacterized protein n=1 Tax=Apophysomyces ossiformis TaxID=679940 RepID=A0A8H7BIH1_9FUNG|nr:hypothetical protein EC973_004270 [Apophysomyces ossiformis]